MVLDPEEPLRRMREDGLGTGLAFVQNLYVLGRLTYPPDEQDVRFLEALGYSPLMSRWTVDNCRQLRDAAGAYLHAEALTNPPPRLPFLTERRGPVGEDSGWGTVWHL